MKQFLSKYHRPLFYLAWFILNIIQAGHTELLSDEAYYWIYAKYPAWGYFDHPPLLAILIKAGCFLFPGELGVRFFMVVLNLLSIYLIDRMLEKKNDLLFYAIVVSLFPVQVAGILAVPDIPLVFFTALVFFCYRRFLNRMNAGNTVLLGVAAALLLYSKYHGVLVLFFILLSNIKLFTRYQTYLAGAVALVLFFPHLWWQYAHDFLTARYHLFERGAGVFRIAHITDYLAGQVLFAGPITGFILLPAAFSYKAKDAFSRSLRYCLAGVLIFFFLSSFKGRVEPNWTVPILIPLIMLSHQYLLARLKWQKILYRLSFISFFIFLAGRIYMMIDLGPDNKVKNRFHHQKEWAFAVKEKAGNTPVVFMGSHQRASVYWFYTGTISFSFNPMYTAQNGGYWLSRKDNFNLWPVEDSLLGKPAVFVSVPPFDSGFSKIETPVETLGYKHFALYPGMTKVEIETAKYSYKAKAGEAVRLNYVVKTPSEYEKFLEAHPEVKTEIVFGIFDNRTFIKMERTGMDIRAEPGRKREYVLHPGLKKGKYTLIAGIISDRLPPSHNSVAMNLLIE